MSDEIILYEEISSDEDSEIEIEISSDEEEDSDVEIIDSEDEEDLSNIIGDKLQVLDIKKFEKKNLNINLFNHQVTSIIDLEKREKCEIIHNEVFVRSSIGIFADQGGRGKTLSILSLIARDKMVWDLNKDRIFEEIITKGPIGLYSSNTQITKKKIKPTLIIVGPSLISQWILEIKNIPKLTYYPIKKRSEIIKTVSKANKYDIILCTSTMYKEFIQNFTDYSWKRFVYDEAATEHITSMSYVYAGFYWFITATYQDLPRINGVRHFMKNIFRNIHTEIFNNIIVKNDNEYIEKSIKINDPIIKFHECINPNVFNVVGQHLPNDVAIMISAGNMSGAIKSLGGSEDTTENIIELVSKKKKMELEEAKHKVKMHEPNKNKDRLHKEIFEKWEKRVKDIKKELKEIEEKYAEMFTADCEICADEMDSPVVLPCCQNFFCAKCILATIKSCKDKHKAPTCPMCRAIILDSKLKVMVNKLSNVKPKEKEKPKQKVKEIKSKADTIVDIIKEKPKGKYLVFSQYHDSFALIKNQFHGNNFKFIEIKGSSDTRTKKLDDYKNGKVNIIFLNSNIDSAGLNLEMTTDIILYHNMPKHTEDQIIWRANRIGRKGTLTIHKLDPPPQQFILPAPLPWIYNPMIPPLINNPIVAPPNPYEPDNQGFINGIFVGNMQNL